VNSSWDIYRPPPLHIKKSNVGQNTNNRKHNTIQKTKKISTTDSTTKNNAVNPGVLKGSIR
jgi:hypothetical protein